MVSSTASSHRPVRSSRTYCSLRRHRGVRGDVVLVAERDRLGHVPLRLGELAPVGVDGRQVRVGPGRLVVVAAGQREIQRPAHLVGPVQVLGGGAGGLGVQRVAEHVVGAEHRGQLLGPSGQVDGRVVVGVEHPQVGERGVGPGQFDGGPERLEGRHRGLGGGDRLRAAAHVPPDARQPAQHVAFAQPVARLPPQGQRVLAGQFGLPPPVQQRRLVRVALMQPGQFRRVGPVAPFRARVGALGSLGEPQRPLVLGRRLPVGGQPGGLARGGRGVAQHRRPVAGRLGMEGQPGVVLAAHLGQRRQHQPVDGLPAVGRDGLGHRQPRDLVPEPHTAAVPVEQPAGDQFVDRRVDGAVGGLLHRRLEQRELDPGAGQRGEVQHLARVTAQPRGAGQDRVAGRRRDGRGSGPQHLGQVERVAAGQPVQLLGLQAAVGRQHLHRPRRQRRQPDAPGVPLGGQIPQRDPQRIVGRQRVVPVGGDQQHRRVAQPPPDVPQQVERRVVGPVDVLDHHDIERAGCADLSEQGPEQLVPIGPGAAQLGQLAAELLGQVEQRPERTGREQAVARPPPPAPVQQLAAHPLEQGRLPDARLAGDQHQPALAAASLGGVLPQRRQRRFPFQQRSSVVHPHFLRPHLPKIHLNPTERRTGPDGLSTRQWRAP